MSRLPDFHVWVEVQAEWWPAGSLPKSRSTVPTKASISCDTVRQSGDTYQLGSFLSCQRCSAKYPSRIGFDLTKVSQCMSSRVRHFRCMSFFRALNLSNTVRKSACLRWRGGRRLRRQLILRAFQALGGDAGEGVHFPAFSPCVHVKRKPGIRVALCQVNRTRALSCRDKPGPLCFPVLRARVHWVGCNRRGWVKSNCTVVRMIRVLIPSTLHPCLSWWCSI